MQVGFFFWPYTLDLCERLAERADRYGYAMIGIADTPGNAMDPWVSAAMVARASQRDAGCALRHQSVDAPSGSQRRGDCFARSYLERPRRAWHRRRPQRHEECRIVEVDSQRPCRRRRVHQSSFCEASPRASARLPPICPGSNVHRRSFSRRRIHRRCGQQDRLLTACSPILDWVQTIFGISESHIIAGAKAAGRSPEDIEIWQIAALDCSEDRNVAQRKVGAMLAFLAGYVIGDRNLETRGVPEPLRAPLLELRRRYSTRPGEADIKLVQELDLFDYLSRRLSICGNPQDCLAAGAQRQGGWRQAADADGQPCIRSRAHRGFVRPARTAKIL